MSKYELDTPDEVVKELIGDLVAAGGYGEVVRQLRAQIPIPAPVKIGAVVRTTTGDYVRWAYDAHTHEPWLAANTADDTHRTDAIGRITEVLSPGVDL